MPSDFVTEFRQRFVDFHRRTALAAYQYESGRKERRETEFQNTEFSDLWSISTLAALRVEISSAHFEIDRVELERLLSFAFSARLNHLVRQLSDEIRQWESSASVLWEGGRNSIAECGRLCLTESDPARRNELWARLEDKKRQCDDLRSERFEVQRSAVLSLGFKDYLDFQKQIRRIDFEALESASRSILTNTAAQCREVAATILPTRAHVAMGEARMQDLQFALQLDGFKPGFPGWRLMHSVRETFSGLGIHMYKQANLHLEQMETSRSEGSVACFPIEVPNEVRALYSNADGVHACLETFQLVSKAEQYAWTSGGLPGAFQYLRDESVLEGFAMLFGSLLREERWLGEIQGLRDNRELRRALAVKRLLETRLIAAGMIFESEFHSSLSPESRRSRFSELYGEASSANADDPGFLSLVRDDSRAAVLLRASAFESQLREFMKVKYGSRWWASRRAGDFLIEVWNTGGRYDAEELARLIDLGDLSYDWLSEELIREIRD